MMEVAHQKDRQRNKGCAERAGDEICRRRQLANIEFMLAHHAAKGADLRNDIDKFEIDAFGFNVARLDGFDMGIVANGDGEFDIAGHAAVLLLLVSWPDLIGPPSRRMSMRRKCFAITWMARFCGP